MVAVVLNAPQKYLFEKLRLSEENSICIGRSFFEDIVVFGVELVCWHKNDRILAYVIHFELFIELWKIFFKIICFGFFVDLKVIVPLLILSKDLLQEVPTINFWVIIALLYFEIDLLQNSSFLFLGLIQIPSGS